MIKVANLFEKTSKSGNKYFVGRLGDAKVLLLKDSDQADASDPKWNLLLDERQEKRTADGQQDRERRDRAVSEPMPQNRHQRDFQHARD